MITEIINSVISAIIGGLFSIYIFKKTENKRESKEQITQQKIEDKRIKERNIKFNEWKQNLKLIKDNLNINLPNSNHPVLFQEPFSNSDKEFNGLVNILTHKETKKLENLYALCKKDYEKLVNYKTQKDIDDNFQKLRKISISSFENLFNCFQ